MPSPGKRRRQGSFRVGVNGGCPSCLSGVKNRAIYADGDKRTGERSISIEMDALYDGFRLRHTTDAPPSLRVFQRSAAFKISGHAGCPGALKVWRNMTEPDRKGLFEKAGQALPVGRVGKPEDLAETYLYLMRERFSTGAMSRSF
jgi:hypothetical protein